MTENDNQENMTVATGIASSEEGTAAPGFAEPSGESLTVGPDQNQEAPPRPMSDRKMMKMSQKSNKQISRIIRLMQERNKKQQTKLREKLERMKLSVGKEDFKALVAICTTFIPEKKDEKGNLVQEASNQVNFQALEKEVHNLVVMKREKRIKEGLRKRSTGRSSDRKLHKATYDYLLKRNQETVENKEEASTVKV